MTNWLCDLAGFGSSESCFRIFANILKLQCYLTVFGLLFDESFAERQQALSSVLSKVYQNPYYFYNLNPLNSAFNRLPTVNSPTTAFGQHTLQKPIFSVQLRPADQPVPQETLLPNSKPSRFFYADPLAASIPFSLLYHQLENKFTNELSKPTNQYEPNRRNPLFQHRVGSVSENGGLPSDLLDQRLDAFHEQNRHTIVGHWCNEQMLQTLQPYCFCGRNRMTKNTIICSNVPDEIALRRSLHAAAVLLNLEGIYRISKLRIFNSTVEHLNLQTLPSTLSVMLIQLNKVGLRAFDQLAVLHTSMQQLRKLDLSNNELEEFPFSELFQLNGLLILKLPYNHLRTLPDDALKGCNRLKMLDLSFNQLNYLGNHAFSGALNLKYLNLRYNQLKVLNNFALAFQPSSVVLFINLSNNQMRLIAENAFENLIVHRLYLNNNRLRKFPQSLFEPILSNMAKINIEQKIFFGETELNHPEGTGLGGQFSDITFRNAVVDRASDKLVSQATRNVSSRADSTNNQLDRTTASKLANGNPVHKEKKINGLSGDEAASFGIVANQLRDHFTDVYRKYLRFLSPNISPTSHPKVEQTGNESPKAVESNLLRNSPLHQLSLEDFNRELNILFRLDLGSGLLEQLVYDLMLRNLNFTRLNQLDEHLAGRKRRLNSDRLNSTDSLSADELDSSFYSQLFDLQAETQADEQSLADHKPSLNLAKHSDHFAKQFLDSSDSFREEIKISHNSSVFFDDEPTQNFDFSRPSTHLNFENDQNAAFIDVLDNDFQCNCKDFKWLFKLKKGQQQSLKEFHCANLAGQKKFLNLEQLTLSDINCWATF